MLMRSVRPAVASVLVAAVVVAAAAAAPTERTGSAYAGTRTIRVRSEPQFEAAVSALQGSGGVIILLPHAYERPLIVPARSARLLRIVGAPGVRVQRILFDRTQRVSLNRLTVAPLTGDAWVKIQASRHIDLHALVVTAQGTRYSASVLLADSRHITIRRSIFTHCGDRSQTWSFCLLFYPSSDITVENNWFHDCYGCDFIHGRFGSDLTIRANRFDRALPCSRNSVRCGHQDLIEMFAGQRLRVEANYFGVYKLGGAQLYLTNAIDHVLILNNVFIGTDPRCPRTARGWV